MAKHKARFENLPVDKMPLDILREVLPENSPLRLAIEKVSPPPPTSGTVQLSLFESFNFRTITEVQHADEFALQAFSRKKFDIGVTAFRDPAPDILGGVAQLADDGKGGAVFINFENPSEMTFSDVTQEMIDNAIELDAATLGLAEYRDPLFGVRVEGGKVYLVDNVIVDPVGGTMTFDWMLFGS